MGTTGSTVSMADYLTVAESLVNSGGVYNENTLRRIRDPKRLEQERRAQEALSRDDQTVSEESVQDQDGASDQETDSEEPDGRRSGRDTDSENVEETPKKRPGLLEKRVPQVAELDPSRAQGFYNSLEQHKAIHPEGYYVELKSLWDIGTKHYYNEDIQFQKILDENTIKEINEGIKTFPTIFKTFKAMIGHHYIPMPVIYIHKNGSKIPAISYNKVSWTKMMVYAKVEYMDT